MRNTWWLVTLLPLCGCNAISGINDYAVGPATEQDSSAIDSDAAEPADAPADVEGETHDSASDDGGSDGDASMEVAIDSADAPPTQKRVFVTSESYTADLGGLAGADAKCQKLADAAKLGGTYRAWLSDSTTHAKYRLTHATVPYRLVDNTLVALDWTDLTSGSLAHAIDVTEKGGKPSYVSTDTNGCYSPSTGPEPSVFTNTTPAGSRAGNYTCADWTSATGYTVTESGYSMGRAKFADGWWSEGCSQKCCACGSPPAAATGGLYCFEQ